MWESASLDGDTLFAYAALVIRGRLTHLSVQDAIEYLYNAADEFGVDDVTLAHLIVQAAERRAIDLCKPRDAGQERTG